MDSAAFTEEIAGRAVVVRCHPALERHAHWLLGVLRELSQDGVDLWAGQRIEVGWSMLTLREDGKHWVVCEPDFATDPFRMNRDDVTTSLTVQAQQNDVVRRVGVDPVRVSFQDVVLVGDGCLQRPDIYLERVGPPDPSHSGWYVGPVVGDVARRQSFYVFEVLRARPAIVQALSLPYGYLAVFEGDQIVAVLNEQEQDLWTHH